MDAFNAHIQVNPLGDLEKPVVLPWFMKEFTTTHRVYERNAYYYEVDTAGNQLPYIDTIVNNLAGKETIRSQDRVRRGGRAGVQYVVRQLHAVQGESEASAGYTVYPIPGILGSQLAFGFNLNNEGPGAPDPVQRCPVPPRDVAGDRPRRDERGHLLRTGHAAAGPRSIPPPVFYKKEWGEAYAQFDPGRGQSAARPKPA